MSEKDQVIQALRATLISVKGALTVQQCNRDFKELQGEWIPYKKLGYESLEKLFLDVPGFKLTQRNGVWYVDAIASQETQHIVSMIAKQKPSKKSRSKLTYPSRFPKRQDSWRKPASNNYSSNYSNQYSYQSYYGPKGSTSNGSYGSSYGTHGYNNNHSIKNSNKYVKPAEIKTTTNYPKPNKSSYDYSETMTTNSAPKAPDAAPPQHNSRKQEAPAPAPAPAPARQQDTKVSQPVRVEPQVEVKQSAKVSASQRLSNLRDRLNTVDLIPLQLPAVTNEYSESSGPVTLVAPALALEPPPDSTSSVAKLEWTCQKLGLPQPVYKVHEHRAKRGPANYDCSIKVGSQYNATSYPDSSLSEALAREVAAVKVLSAMESSGAAGLPASDADAAVSCLADLVAEHEAGLWASTVPHLYREKYGENLPSNWQELVENCPRIKKDRVINGLLVLLPNNEEPPTFYHDMTTLSDDTLIDDASGLPTLIYPEDNYWNVYVTVANSTLEVWLRIIGEEYNEALEELLAEMEQYYQHYGSIVDKSMIIQNAWYAVNLEEGWQRAKLLELEAGGAASVFLGDHGDLDTVPLHRIKILEPQFRRLPAQAILSRLEGAEELAASSEAADLVRQRLLDQVLVAEPRPCGDPSERAVSVVLYDTSTQRDLNLNKEIINDFCTAGAFTITQQLCEVVVGCVTEEGRVWVSRCGGAALVSQALGVITAGEYRRRLPASPAAPPPPPPPRAPRPVYIVRTLDGDWVRCVIISGLDGEGTVRTQLVDSGLVLRAPLSSLVPLQEFSRALNSYPHQAICVRLGAAERACSAMAGRLRELLLHTRVICRALPAPAAPPAPPAEPHVELFVRTEPQHILASVNNNILMEYDRQLGKPKEESISTTEHVEAIHRKKERVFRNSAAAPEPAAAAAAGAGALPPAALPRVGQCCDVRVAMAANPWNFVVQPNSTRPSLQDMMASLQTECPKLPETDAPLMPASGELYTVFYDKDKSWYRVVVAGTVSTDMVSVYFCDYGDLALFAVRELRAVPAAVPLARSLPPQAIKARLYDVLPHHQDWTVEDCIRFQELCVEQQFVGVCKELGRDPLHAGEPLMTLDLIDTTTDEDIYLSRQLVAEGRARLASSLAAAADTADD